MKNIHVLPIGKPSRLFENSEGNLILSKVDYAYLLRINRAIYITSDEEIKIDEYYLCKLSMKLLKCIGDEYFNNIDEKKIILTTDKELIKDGVKNIDDEFLEWFVQNPSCEEVEVISISRCCGRCYVYDDLCVADKCCDDHHEYGCEICYGKKIDYKLIIPKEEPKQETLEEASERLYPYEIGYGVYDRNCEIDFERERFIAGAKWQQERSYSKEEVLSLLMDFRDNIPNDVYVVDWFEKFKKEII